jgi:lactate 2-monooxygenase
LTKLPTLLKGLLHPDDARLAVDHGVDGIVVSNHGGRQVDGSIASLDALPAVAEAVAGRVPIVFDSGVRGGADAFKALALGATAVLIGRPYVYGLAFGGEAGVREVIRNFVADFDLTLGLAGCRSTTEIGPECLQSVS